MAQRGGSEVADTGAQESDKQRLVELEKRLHEAENALRVSNLKLRMGLEVGRLGAWELDLQTGEVIGNVAFKTHLKLSPDAYISREHLRQMYHPEDIGRIDQAISYSIKTKTDFQIEHRIIRQDGSIGRLLSRGNATYGQDGQPVRLIGVTQDVTEREKVKEEISHAQRRQEFLLELNDQIGNLDNPVAIMETAARSVGRFLQVDSSGFAEVFDEQDLVTVLGDWSTNIITHAGRTYQLKEIVPAGIEMIRQGQPLMVEDVKVHPALNDPSLQAWYSSYNLRAFLSVPLLKTDKLKVIAYVYSAIPRTWTSDDVALIEDVADRTWIAVGKVRAEREAREKDARFRMIAESLPALVWIIDLNLELVYTNERWLVFSGLQPSEALGDSWMHWVHPDDLARVAEDMKTVRQNESSYATEMRYRSADGVYRWHMVRAAPMRDSDGQLTGWIGTSVDIHDLKETEEALRNRERQLSIALEAAKMGDWHLDAATNVIALSERAAEIFGLPPGSSITREQLRDHIYEPDVNRIVTQMRQAVENRTQFNVEYRVTKMGGDKGQIWTASQGQGTYHPDGTPSGMTGVIQDITDRKHAEQRQQLLIRELHHRVKNTLATVQAIVGSTARTASSIDEFYQGFVGRIVSLARTHNLLTEDLWQKAALEELIHTELGPYEDESHNRIVIEGPHLELPSEAAVPIGMAIHELTTNAAKHGALSTFGGQVEVRWTIEPSGESPILHFSWTERGGPRVTTPSRQGFGSRLLQRVLTTQLQAQVNMDFQENGVHFTMVMPIPGDPPLFNPDK